MASKEAWDTITTYITAAQALEAAIKAADDASAAVGLARHAHQQAWRGLKDSVKPGAYVVKTETGPLALVIQDHVDYPPIITATISSVEPAGDDESPTTPKVATRSRGKR